MTGNGLRGANGQPAAPPYTNGPYTWDQAVNFSQGFSGANSPGKVYYVSRNRQEDTSGDGSSWEQAFLTLAEAIAAVNADYSNGTTPDEGRNRHIYIAEGWYAEVPVILTASDVHIIGVAPGHHDSTVIYGVPVAGTFSGVAGGPTLTITGSNNTIMNVGWYCSDPLYGAIRNGANASDGDAANPGASGPTGNAFINCGFVRDVADGELCGIDDLGADGTLIDSCFFSTSCKDMGVRSRTNGVINPVNLVVRNCRFVGTPTGIAIQAGHNALLDSNSFFDDTSDRPDVVDTPIVITATSAMCINNYGMTTKANLITGAGTINDIGNWGSDSST
jgi:hypothetical protein